MSLIKNSFFNITGYVLPTLIAIPALGYLARSLGAERFGIFTLAMAIVGYAGIFDGGLTRAVTREISLFRDNHEEKFKISASAIFAVIILGTIGTLLLFFFSENVCNLLKVDKTYTHEVVFSLKLLSLSIPIFLMNQIWLAVLEGEEKFFNVNVQRWIGSSLLAGLPALTFMLLKPDLTGAITGLLMGRIFSLLANILFNHKFIFASGICLHKKTFFRLVKYGSWITVSNIISPLMSYFDRFIVSHLSGANLVAFYSAPAEAISRLTIIPGALSRAIFPKLSYARSESERKKYIKTGNLILALVCIPIATLGFCFAEDILVLWLGENFRGMPALILRVLLVGFVFNSFAQIPFATIQAMGKAKNTAILHLLELLPYLILLYLLVHKFGIIGAALAWSIRVVIDAVMLMCIASFHQSKRNQK